MRVPELNKQNIYTTSQVVWIEENKNGSTLTKPWYQHMVQKKILVVTKSYLKGCLSIYSSIFHKSIYHTQYVGVSKNRGTPKWMVYNGKSYKNWWWFGGTPIFWKHPCLLAKYMHIDFPMAQGIFYPRKAGSLDPAKPSCKEGPKEGLDQCNAPGALSTAVPNGSFTPGCLNNRSKTKSTATQLGGISKRLDECENSSATAATS